MVENVGARRSTPLKTETKSAERVPGPIEPGAYEPRVAFGGSFEVQYGKQHLPPDAVYDATLWDLDKLGIAAISIGDMEGYAETVAWISAHSVRGSIGPRGLEPSDGVPPAVASFLESIHEIAARAHGLLTSEPSDVASSRDRHQFAFGDPQYNAVQPHTHSYPSYVLNLRGATTWVDPSGKHRVIQKGIRTRLVEAPPESLVLMAPGVLHSIPSNSGTHPRASLRGFFDRPWKEHMENNNLITLGDDPDLDAKLNATLRRRSRS